MKSLYQILPITLIFLGFSAVGCKKCKECYFVEEANGNKTESSLGEFCGDEIDEQENKDFIANSGLAYIECR